MNISAGMVSLYIVCVYICVSYFHGVFQMNFQQNGFVKRAKREKEMEIE